MPQISVGETEDFDHALRRFRKMVDRDGIVQEFKSRTRESFKPSIRKKRKAFAAARRNKRRIKREMKYG